MKRIRPQSLEPVDYTREQYSRALWFSEGVTSTVADILEMRAGLTDEKHLLAHLASRDRRDCSRAAPASRNRSRNPAWIRGSTRTRTIAAPSAASPTMPRASYWDFSSTLKCAA